LLKSKIKIIFVEMKKQVFKGNATKTMQDVEDFYSTLSDGDLQKTFQVTIDQTRSLESNALFHLMVKELCAETGEENVNKMKRDIKEALYYYTDTKVETEDSCYITRLYTKTSEMSSKELSEFILKIEVWAAQNLGYTFECTQNNKKPSWGKPKTS